MALAAVVLLATVAGYLLLNAAAARTLERGGRYAMGVATHVETVDLRPLRGEASVHRLRVANPEGYSRELLLSLEQGEAAVELGSLMGQRIVLPRLHLRGVRIEIEHDHTGRANYEPVLEHLERVASRARHRSPQRRYLVRELIVSDITIAMKTPLPFGPREPITLELDEVRLSDVGAGPEGGVLMSELCTRIVQHVVEAASAETMRTLPGSLLDGLTRRPRHAPDPSAAPHQPPATTPEAALPRQP